MKTTKRVTRFFGFACILMLLIFINMQIIHSEPYDIKEKRPDIEKVFKAGAATANITPPLGLGIVGGWGTPETTHIHDELHARCLVLDNEEKNWFLLSWTISE
jgi:hypothetical protein